MRSQAARGCMTRPSRHPECFTISNAFAVAGKMSIDDDEACTSEHEREAGQNHQLLRRNMSGVVVSCLTRSWCLQMLYQRLPELAVVTPRAVDPLELPIQSLTTGALVEFRLK